MVHQQCGILELILLRLILRVVLIFLSMLICHLMNQYVTCLERVLEDLGALGITESSGAAVGSD